MSDTEKLRALTQAIKTMYMAVNNEAPDLMLLELDRTMQMLEGWENDSRSY